MPRTPDPASAAGEDADDVVHRGLAAFTAIPVGAARRELLSCCASPVWAASVAAARPYADLDGLLDTGARAVSALPGDEIGRALQAHPRIGERPAGTNAEAAWSRREQALVSQDSSADEQLQAALRAANLAYEQRFDRVFLIFATGRSAQEILAEAHRRLGNDDATEQREVVGELARITRLRLARLIEHLGEGAAAGGAT